MQNEEIRTAQAQIEAGQARYRNLYDLAPVGYCTLSEQGLILEANLTAATLLGTARDSLIKQPISRFILKEDQDIYYLHRKKLFETNVPQECELRVVKPDGACFWADLTGTAAQKEDGGPVCLVAIRDITDRKRAEEARKASEHKYRIIADYTYDWEGWHDNKGTLMWVNPAVERMIGRTTEECLAMRDYPLPLIHPEDRHVFETLKVQAQAGKSGNDIPFRIVREEHPASATWATVSWNPVSDERGTPDGYRTSVRDITERKRDEEALRESEGYLRSTQDGLSAHIAVLDERGEIILTNKSYRDFGEHNGIEPGAVFEGTNYLAVCDTASGDYSDEAGPFAEGIREVLSGKRRCFELEYPCHSPDKKRWFIGRTTPIQGVGPRRVVVAHENITERKQAEGNLLKNQYYLTNPPG